MATSKFDHFDASGKFREGDVVTYERGNTWCRDGWAVARETRDGRVVLADTYWSGGSETHIVTIGESENGIKLEFNLDDYFEFKRGSNGYDPKMGLWQNFAESDRKVIPEHAGHRRRLFARRGAVEDRQTIIDNARAEVEDRKVKVESAQRALEFAEEALDRLLTAEQ